MTTYMKRSVIYLISFVNTWANFELSKQILYHQLSHKLMTVEKKCVGSFCWEFVFIFGKMIFFFLYDLLDYKRLTKKKPSFTSMPIPLAPYPSGLLICSLADSLEQYCKISKLWKCPKIYLIWLVFTDRS